MAIPAANMRFKAAVRSDAEIVLGVRFLVSLLVILAAPPLAFLLSAARGVFDASAARNVASPRHIARFFAVLAQTAVAA